MTLKPGLYRMAAQIPDSDIHVAVDLDVMNEHPDLSAEVKELQAKLTEAVRSKDIVTLKNLLKRLELSACM